MPITLDGVDVGKTYTLNFGFIDQAGESARKVSRLKVVQDADDPSNVAAFVADLSHAGVSSLTGKLELATDLDLEPNITLSGLYTLNNLRLVLGFEKVHPLNPSKIVTTTFSIPAPVNAIVSSTNPKKPLMTRGGLLAAATTDLTKLGALVDYLEDALVYKAADGADYAGGWTYVEARSGLATVAGVIDGDART